MKPFAFALALGLVCLIEGAAGNGNQVDECSGLASSIEQLAGDFNEGFAQGAVDRIIDTDKYNEHGSYALLPGLADATCSDVVYLTVDLGAEEQLTGVKWWHYWKDGRSYCNQSIELSSSGGEEDWTRVFSCGTYEECGEASAEGKEVVFEKTSARYVRLGSSRNTKNHGVHILEVQPQLANPCHNLPGSSLSWTCTNTPGSYNCSCSPGWETGGTDGACKDVEECATGVHNCDENAACTDGGGSFTCACEPGFTGDGTTGTCEDIDECSGLVSSIEQLAGDFDVGSAQGAVDGIIDTDKYNEHGSYALLPGLADATCSDVVYLTVDLGAEEQLTGVKWWHYWKDGRSYCNQSIELSSSGGEEDWTRVFSCGTYEECGEASAEGKEVVFEKTSARYVRLGSSRNTKNHGVHILEVQPQLANPCYHSETDVTCENTLGSFKCFTDCGDDVEESTCLASCGDGYVWDTQEECDDGNDSDYDGCTNQCKWAVCGDGLLHKSFEACDDGNTVDGDGCSSQCAAERKPAGDLARSCGVGQSEACAARQSTFYKLNDPPPAYAVDAAEETCMKTASGTADPNPQWWMVDLEEASVVRTVRFESQSDDDSEFVVKVSEIPAPDAAVQNPSAGTAIPSGTEDCVVSPRGAGSWEADCGGAKGQYVFIARSEREQMLNLCNVEVFPHACLTDSEEDEQVVCGLGYEPSGPSICRGCRPCVPGTYSDEESSDMCKACPGSTPTYSPEGSTSEFQCFGDAYVDGSSALQVGSVEFDQANDSWVMVIRYKLTERFTNSRKLFALFLSIGGSDVRSNSFTPSKFPCRVDESRASSQDLSSELTETACCLQDFRQDYAMTRTFRTFTDALDLVAANDVCDGPGGSNILLGADVPVVDAAGDEFVDPNGRSFDAPITIIAGSVSEDGFATATIVVPDAELYKVSRSGGSGRRDDGSLIDVREMFVGLLDMVPTGTRVLDTASQQVAITLTRTQYGTFAAYGEQNIDYDFISFLNARAHTVIDQSSDDLRRGIHGDQYYAEITFVYDDRLQPVDATGAVDITTVAVEIGGSSMVGPCASLPAGFQDVVDQSCGPSELEWGPFCPQVSIPDDSFGRLYIPLGAQAPSGTVHIEFDLWFKDKSGRQDKVPLAMDLVVGDFVTWCDTRSGSVDLAERVTPRIIVGTESANPPRLDGWEEMEDGDVFSTGAETLQDGLVTMILELNETNGLDDNLEVFFEDVLVIHVNPGSQPDVNQIKNAITGQDSKYMPTYNYDPDSRDARLNIPEDLKTDCPAEDATTSFFGCVHKHILRNKVITNETDAYLVGSAPPPAAGAQDFVQTMLGDGTASVAARELGRDFEGYLMTTEGVTGTSRKSIGLWIHPGHKWGGITANSEYSLSNHLIIYVLFGVKAGVDGTERRMLLQATADGTTSLVRTLEYNVNAASLVESVMGNVIAIEVEARLLLSAEEACLPLDSLREICSQRLQTAIAPHASQIEAVECVSVAVENADCDGARRADTAPVAHVDAVIALAESAHAFLDVDAVVASGSVLSMTQTVGKPFASTKDNTLTALDNDIKQQSTPTASGSGSNTMLIGAAAGAVAGVVVVSLMAWQASKKCREPALPLTEVASAGVVGQTSMSKVAIEDVLFGGGAAEAGTRHGDSQKQLLPVHGADGV